MSLRTAVQQTVGNMFRGAVALGAIACVGALLSQVIARAREVPMECDVFLTGQTGFWNFGGITDDSRQIALGLAALAVKVFPGYPSSELKEVSDELKERYATLSDRCATLFSDGHNIF